MASLPFKHPKGLSYFTFDEIDMDDRGRTDYGDLSHLATSIKTYGLIQAPLAVPYDPPVNGKRVRLIAGGRRTMAMLSLAPSHIPLALRSDIKDTGTLVELELEENINRKDMSWMEEALLIRKAHYHHKVAGMALSESWGASQTGRLFKKSTAHVQHALLVADKIIDGDTELAACTSIGGAYDLLLRRKEQEVDGMVARSQLGKRAAAHAATTATSKSSTPISPMPPGTGMHVRSNAEDDIDAIFAEPVTALESLEAHPPVGVDTFFNGRSEFPLSEWCTMGDSIQTILPSWPDASVDAIITDPPYGIDINEEHLANAAEIAGTHIRSENIAMFPEMIAQFYRVLKDRAYCIFWFDIEHYERLKKLAIKAGFAVQNHPVTWVKTHQCKNLAPKTNFTSKTEFAMVCRKGTATLQIAGPDSIIVADGSIDKKMYSNPFAKPYSVWAHLILPTTRPGDVVADPFAGQMSCPRALLNLGRIPKAVELDEHHYNKGITILASLIKELAGDKVMIY